MKYDFLDYRENYLEHYGVLGMKWGVRKSEYYDRKARIATSKAAKAKTRFGRTFYGDRAADFKEAAKTSRRIKSRKGLLAKRRAFKGMDRTASQHAAASEKAANRAKLAKTKLGKNYREAQSFNFKQSSKAANLAKNARFGKRTLTYYKQRMKMPAKTITGKETTYGKAFAKTFLVGAGASLVANIGMQAAIKALEKKAGY